MLVGHTKIRIVKILLFLDEFGRVHIIFTQQIRVLRIYEFRLQNCAEAPLMSSHYL
jgi:hypothetical protein